MNYRTPGVYIEEVATFPPSVVQGATAVPVFIGYTEKGPAIARVDTFLEYRDLFGGADTTDFEVDVSTEPITVSLSGTGPHPRFNLYYCLSHYFANGGGQCFVASAGNYDEMLSKQPLLDGLALAEKEDEPTLIVIPEAVNLAAPDYHEICGAALAQCEKLGDRFAILDVKDGDVEGFRNAGMTSLMHGAAYHPYLQTSIHHVYDEDEVTVVGLSLDGTQTWSGTFNPAGITVQFTGAADGGDPTVTINAGDTSDLEFEVADRALTITNVEGKTGTDVVAAFGLLGDAGQFSLTAAGDGSAMPDPTTGATALVAVAGSGVSLGSLTTTNTAVANEVKAALGNQRVVLPPSPAIAGVFARVDRDRGVWKAPANVPVLAVIAPTEKITHEDQETLNVDADGGKSINAIRGFTGKGTLVWGARTLAGNDNEWRFVPVRRLFTVIEDATRKASAFAVFEPNDATTWLKVKGMIESYLYGLWEQGALAGPTPEAAYFVNVGLGRTMTPQDVLEGRMIVEIGVAAVRPAEFIIIRFSHKLQEA